MSGERVQKDKTTTRFKAAVWSTAAAVVLAVGILACYYLAPVVTAEAIEVVPGISVRGVDLSRLERLEGIERLAELESKVHETTVNLMLAGSGYEVALGELGITVDRDKTMDRALAVGNELGVFKRWYAGMRHVDRPLDPVLSLDESVLRQYWQKRFGPPELQARDAYLRINADERVEVVPSIDGYVVDFDLLTERLVNPSVLFGDAAVDVPVRLIQPEVTTEQVRRWGVTGLMAEFTTRFNPDQVDRNHNIATAAVKLDGWMVGPGEVFSFNEVVGSRGLEQGYRMANVIVGNKLEEDLGGGVCQVSTTLYNAVLLADLAVEQRSNHSIPVSYVPVGRDAAVAYDYLDFKFKNVLDSHVLIKTFIGSDSLTVKIYGAPDPHKQVQIESRVTKTIEPETVYEIDPAVEPGAQKVVQKGTSGYIAAAERLVLVDGREARREPLFDSKYKPVEQIIAVHSKADIPGAGLAEEPPSADDSAADEPAGDNPDHDGATI